MLRAVRRGSSPTPFHPELRHVARMLPRVTVTSPGLKVTRTLSKLQGRRLPRDVEVLTLPSGVRIWLYRPTETASRTPALLWIHGGGYLAGSPAQDDRLCRRYSRELGGATVASVDYRLAPEHPYPLPLEDCYAALAWLAHLPTVDSSRVAIGGASAGGGLAAALAQLAHHRGEVSVAAQLLVYPMLDDRTAQRDDLDNPSYRLWNNRSNRFAWASYLGAAEPNVAVPARRADLSGLPPTWIGVGTLDLFHDENLAYAERLRSAEVPCEIEIVPGAFHGFDKLAPRTRVSRSFFASQCAMLSGHARKFVGGHVQAVGSPR